MKCGNCAAIINAEPPTPQIINTPSFSAYVLVHEQGLDCPGCPAYYVWFINPQGNIGLVATEKPKEAPLVSLVPGLPGRVRTH
jgi:hypothetical protein